MTESGKSAIERDNLALTETGIITPQDTLPEVSYKEGVNKQRFDAINKENPFIRDIQNELLLSEKRCQELELYSRPPEFTNPPKVSIYGWRSFVAVCCKFHWRAVYIVRYFNPGCDFGHSGLFNRYFEV